MCGGKKTNLQKGDVVYYDKIERTITFWRDKELLLISMSTDDFSGKANRFRLHSEVSEAIFRGMAQAIATASRLDVISIPSGSTELEGETGIYDPNPMAYRFI